MRTGPEFIYYCALKVQKQKNSLGFTDGSKLGKELILQLDHHQIKI